MDAPLNTRVSGNGRNDIPGQTRVHLSSVESCTSRLIYRSITRQESAPVYGMPKKGHPVLRLNTVTPYYTMFPLDFPLKALRRSVPGEWVLDPFCGRGTTLYAARMRGLGCAGLDSNPIAAAVAAAKLVAIPADAVIELAERILSDSQHFIAVPTGEFWDYCYDAATLRDICRIRHYPFEQGNTPEEVLLRALMLGILHGPLQKESPGYLSNQMPRTYATKPNGAVKYWKQQQLTTPPRVDVLEVLTRRARFVLADYPSPVDGVVFLADARRSEAVLAETQLFSWVITSPPYLGMRTYRPDQWLRNWFLGGNPDVDYDQNGQISHHSDRFTDDLSDVWRSIAQRCLPGARLIIRFGYLPSMPVDAKAILIESLRLADAGWRVLTLRQAGTSSHGNRQAEQFGRVTSDAGCEFDLYARLEG